jgi:hypothetical protein
LRIRLPAMVMIWRCYGDDPLPSPAEALQAPLRAFPSWYLRIQCDRCGRERYLSERHVTLAGRGDMLVGELVEKKLRHEGCGGRPKLAELVTDIPGSSSGSVRRILLIAP